MTEYTLGKREQIAICEEDTWATLNTKSMAINGYIPGKNLVLTPAFTNNWTEILTAGAAARTIDSMQKSALAYKFTLKFVVTDWRFLRYCAHGTVSNTSTNPTVHTFTQTDAVKSFTLEWAKRATTNSVITLTGCIITKVELNFQKSTNAAEGFISATCTCLAKSATTSGTSITTITANAGVPYHFRMAKLTLNTTEIVEVNNGNLTIDNGINEMDCRYANSTLDQAIGEPIPTVLRYSCRFNINQKDGSFYTLFNNQVLVPGTNTLAFIRGTSPADDCTFTFTGLYLTCPVDPTNIEGVDIIDLVGTIVSTAIVANDAITTY